MMRMKRNVMCKNKIAPLTIAIICVILSSFYQLSPTFERATDMKEKLSEYGFFEGNISNQKPTRGVVQYSLNTPLFSDYAEKLRFVKLPDSQAFVLYNENEVFDFPVGTTIIKTFYYSNDFRNPALGRKLIETRLLIHENNGWKALEYIWNDEQTDAFLEIAGDSKPISYTDADGHLQRQIYTIPNLNQCKGCHNRNEKMTPIGPTARQLNGLLNNENQLLNWQKMGIIKNLPALEHISKAAVWNDPTTGSLHDRTRIYLDINCAHCHRPDGPANSSGLNLSIHNQDLTTLGINKSPVAAGRGSGNRKADIVPHSPDESILLFRLQSTDAGIMMPEVGRKVTHKEGVALVRAWIASL
jgi:uncharacterized repeat protein (TIGR03806 family)